MSPPDESAGALRDYAQLKLALADALTGILRAAERQHSDRVAGECQAALARIADDRFILAFVGQFSRGKSSLMNALLGEAKLPTGVLPMTSVITSVAYGDSERVLVQREGWRAPQVIRLDELADYVTQNGNPGNEKKVVAAQIQLPNELLRQGVTFVDTPGVGSTVVANTRATREFIPAIDAAVLVTSVESPMTATELDLLSELSERVPTVFIVINKKDLPSGEDGEVLTSIRQTVENAFADKSFHIFLVSARDALDARKDPSASAFPASGLADLEGALAEYLHTRKTRDFVQRSIVGAARILQEFELESEIKRRLRTPAEAAAVRARIDKRVSVVREAIETLSTRLKRHLNGDFDKQWGAHPAFSNIAIARDFESALQSATAKDSGSLEALPWTALIGRALEGVIGAWRSQHGGEVQNWLEEVLGLERPLLASIRSQIAALGSNVGGHPPDEPGDAEPFQECPSLAFREVHIESALDRSPWWYETIPFVSLRRFLFRRWLRKISNLAGSYRSGLLAMARKCSADWSDDLIQQLTELLDKATAQVTADLHSQPAAGPPVDIGHVHRELDALQRRLDNIEGYDRPGTKLLTPATGSPAEAPCAVCVRIERELYDRMARLQYELYSTGTAQEEHARNLGFCPLHSWQYEAIASPQGVCAAYPPLLDRIATNLRKAAKDGAAGQDGAGTVHKLTATLACRACEWVTAATEVAIRELARSAGNQAGARVCLVHLPLLVSFAPDADAAAGWLSSAASALDRVAENMRNYLLKRDASRHGRSTGAERRAAIAGLARLAGRRSLVAVKNTE